MLKLQAAVFTFTYILRAIFFSILGVVYLVIPSIFWRMELFFIVGTILEGPNLFYLYLSHYRNFVAEDIAKSRIQRSQVINKSAKTIKPRANSNYSVQESYTEGGPDEDSEYEDEIDPEY